MFVSDPECDPLEGADVSRLKVASEDKESTLVTPLKPTDNPGTIDESINDDLSCDRWPYRTEHDLFMQWETLHVMGNNFLISAKEEDTPRKTLFYCSRNKTGGEEEKALLSQSLAEENKIGTGNQLTFRRDSEKDSEHWLLGGASFILGATPTMPHPRWWLYSQLGIVVSYRLLQKR
ncbi:hypothetical protein NDU88_001009 [Pleurodeles waltl]|uniref:Uncharacterized protein n=1 Tax=Pleurodeles waltl TaxID=8319 RepID=A0AAV7P7G7_PLEWA|nr:hypothetical protein NDU88_001009 [Pleurodeles waltl]